MAQKKAFIRGDLYKKISSLYLGNNTLHLTALIFFRTDHVDYYTIGPFQKFEENPNPGKSSTYLGHLNMSRISKIYYQITIALSLGHYKYNLMVNVIPGLTLFSMIQFCLYSYNIKIFVDLT